MRIAVISTLAGLLLAPLLPACVAQAQGPGAPAKGAASKAEPSAAEPRQEAQVILQQAVAEMQRLMKEGRKGEALPVAERALERLMKEAGPDHPLTAVAVFNVGAAQRMSGAYDEAAITLQRAVAMETKLGPASRPSFRRALAELAETEKARGRIAEAIDLYEAALTRLRQSAAGTLAEAELLEEQGALIRHSGALARAEAKFLAALSIKQTHLVASDPGFIATLSQLGGISRLNGRYTEAEAFYKRAIDIVAAGKGEGEGDPNLAILLDNLGVLYQDQARFDEAEGYHKRALAIFEKTLGRDHLSTGQCAASLGAIAYHKRRYADAEKLMERALEIYGKRLPPTDWRIGITLDNLAGVYRAQRRYDRAAASYRLAIDVLRKSYSDNHPDVGLALRNLALMDAEVGRLPEAERKAQEALAIAVRAFGDTHIQVAHVRTTLGYIQSGLGRPDEAKASYARAIAIIEGQLGPEHPHLVGPLGDLAGVVLGQGDAQGAYALFERAAKIELKQRSRGLETRGDDHTPQRDPWRGLIEAGWQLDETARARTGKSSPARAEDGLSHAQWVLHSVTGRTMALLGARLGARAPGLAGLAREHQDLSEEWAGLDRKLTALLSKVSAARTDGDDKPMRARLEAIDARLKEIDAVLTAEHPSFIELAQPKPLPAKDVRALLRPDEALIAYLPAEKALYAWLVTRNEMRWQKVAISRDDLQQKIRALRCGLDPSEWAEPDREQRCLKLTGVAPNGELLPFRTDTAVALYRALLAPFGSAIDGKTLLVAAGGELASMPLQVLLQDEPKDGNLAKAKWLGLRHAMATLPSIASLKSLRRDARPSMAQKPYFGVGNPLLIGPNRDYSASWGAQSCLASQLKKKSVPMAVAKLDGRASGNLVRGGAVDVEQVRLLSPLPETRDELCAVASGAGASEADLALGSRANEKALRELNASGALRTYRVLHFATHGLIAGEVPGLDEAALVLTPPDVVAPDNDGLLTASEVATLKLDADWVILSACNTAAGDRLGAETLSGLARGFFHAGARSLLVSHWPVSSMAAVKLTTRALAELRKAPGLGRAEALRRSMAALVTDPGDPANAHPQVWAPFVVVGEGGSAPPPAAATTKGPAGVAAAGAKEQLPWLKEQAKPTPAAAIGTQDAGAAKSAPKAASTKGPAGAGQAAPKPKAASASPAAGSPAPPVTTQSLPPATPAVQPPGATPPPATAPQTQAPPARPARTEPERSLTDSLFR